MNVKALACPALLMAGCLNQIVVAQTSICPALQPIEYSQCLKEAKSRADRIECAAMIEADLKDVDFWVSCRLDEMDKRHRSEREAVLAQAQRARELLAMRLRTNSVR